MKAMVSLIAALIRWARNEDGTTKTPKLIRVIIISPFYGIFFALLVWSGCIAFKIEEFWAGVFIFVCAFFVLVFWIKDLYIILKTRKKNRSVPLWMQMTYQFIISAASLFLSGCLSLVCFLSKEFVLGVISLVFPVMSLSVLIYVIYRITRMVKGNSKN